MLLAPLSAKADCSVRLTPLTRATSRHVDVAAVMLRTRPRAAAASSRARSIDRDVVFQTEVEGLVAARVSALNDEPSAAR